MSKAHDDADNAAADNVISFMRQIGARQMALEQAIVASLATLGAAFPQPARREWIGSLYKIDAVFADPRDTPAFADMGNEDLLQAAQVARDASDAFHRLIDQVVARLPSTDTDDASVSEHA